LSDCIPLASDSLNGLAGLILDREGHCLADLSQITILLPNLRSAGDLAHRLGEAATDPLILPRITTLENWPDEVLPPTRVMPDSQREALLYAVLKKRGWPAAQLWPLCSELIGILDEMTRHRVGIPDRVEAFEDTLATALGCRKSGLTSFEASLALAAWQTLTSIAQHDRVLARGRRLTYIAKFAAGPLYVVNPRYTPQEESFLSAYAERQPVHRIRIEPGDMSLRSFMHHVVDDPPNLTLEERARLLVPVSGENSGLGDRIRLYAAGSLEEEARGAAASILRWINEGRRQIAVVAQDRMAARRLRALLERVDVLVRDETGWRLSTSIAAAALNRWLDLLGSDFYHRDLLDFIRFPHPFTELDETAREAGVAELEHLIRSHGPAKGLGAYITRSAQEGLEAAHVLLDILRRGQEAFPRRGSSLSAWQAHCLDSLDRLGMTASLSADPAGRQLLELMRRLKQEMHDTQEICGFEEWRQWLDRQLERESFLDSGIDSPIVFTHLAATRLRCFEAALVIGADATHLPGDAEQSGLFGESVRRELGLPSREQTRSDIWDDLVDLASSTPQVLFTWQAMHEGEPNPASPWLTLMDTLHQITWGSSLHVYGLAKTLPPWVTIPDDSAPLPAIMRPPAPSIPPTRIPSRVSVTACQSLTDCPYQFFARHVLKLNEPDEVREEMEKRDYGELAHRILNRMHALHPVFSDAPNDLLETDFERISREVFSAHPHLGYLDRAWSQRWRRTWPAYLQWQLDREAQGWRWLAGELKLESIISLRQGNTVVLRGRLDRLDTRGGDQAVLDYKLRSVSSLKRKIREPGEDIQLPAYGLLKPEATGSEYVSLDNERIASVALEQDLVAASGQLEARLCALFEALHDGASLPAHGAPEVCRHCEMHGLCRIGHW
jgi:ATP-dependent helicase/nuclease subunit B